MTSGVNQAVKLCTMRHKITALGGLSPAAAAAVMSKPAVVAAPEVTNGSQQQEQEQQSEEQCSTLGTILI